MQVSISQLRFGQRDAIEHHAARMLASKSIPIVCTGYEQMNEVLSANQTDPLICRVERRGEIIENEGRTRQTETDFDRNN